MIIEFELRIVITMCSPHCYKSFIFSQNSGLLKVLQRVEYMAFSSEQLRYIYDKTGGYCEYCGKKLAFTNYGRTDARAAWEVDHSNPKCNGGTDYLRNLFPACIDCNRLKGDRTGKSFRKSMQG